MTNHTTDPYAKPVFSEEYFQSFYPMICKIINRETASMRIDSENLERFDDYVNMCRFWMWEHIEKYEPIKEVTDPDTGLKKTVKIKFSTYIHMVLGCRLGSMRENHKKKTRNRHVASFSDYIFYEESDNPENEISFLSKDQSLPFDSVYLKERLETINSQVQEEYKTIFTDYFVHNESAKEIQKRNPNYKYNEVRKIIKELSNTIELGV